MADSIKIIDPFENYTITPQAEAYGNKGNDFLNAVKSLQVGFGSQVLRVNRDGLWLGAADFASAPFKVDMQGNTTLSGYLSVGDALTDIGIGNITGTYIADGAITTAKLTATAIDGMTITGALIRTSASGGRVEIDDITDSVIVYDIGGVRRMDLDTDELSFYNSSGTRIGYITTPSTTNFEITTPTGNALIINAQGTNVLDAIFLQANSVSQITVSDAGASFNNDTEFNSNNINGINRVTGASGYIDYDAGGQIYTNARFAPVTDNVYDLGATNKLWQDIYVSNVHYSTLVLISDKKLKKNIKPLPSSLEQVLNLKPVSFNYKEREVVVEDDIDRSLDELETEYENAKENAKKQSQVKHLGFIAQDVQEIIPELVHKRDDDILTLNSTELIPVLVKAIQELKEEVDKLKK